MSATNVTIKVSMERETSKEFKDIPISFENLDTTKYKAFASSAEETKVDVVVKGVSSIINKLQAKDIVASVDLSNLGAGETKVPVVVSGSDVRLSYTSRTTSITVIISKK